MAKYLVQTGDGTLHSYWTLAILLCDLRVNRNDPPKAIYRLCSEPGFQRKYVPATEAELRKEMEAA